MHVLFHWETPHTIPAEISEEALKAAVNFFDVAIRRNIQENVERIHQLVLGKHNHEHAFVVREQSLYTYKL